VFGIYAIWDNAVFTWQVAAHVFQCWFGNSDFAVQSGNPSPKNRLSQPVDSGFSMEGMKSANIY
jgi:hypothetical protein